MFLLLSRKKPGARRRHGLEGSLFGWAIHQSLNLQLNTL